MYPRWLRNNHQRHQDNLSGIIWQLHTFIAFGGFRLTGNTCLPAGGGGNQVDEERDGDANQRVQNAVAGKFRNADIPAMRDGDAEKSDTGDVGQSAFLQEINQEPGTWKQVSSFPADGNFDLSDDIRQKHQRDYAEGNQSITQDWLGHQVIVMGQVQDTHAGKTAQQRPNSPVQSYTHRAPDF